MQTSTRAKVGQTLVLPLFLLTWLAPLPFDATQQRLLAIVVSVVCLWTTEAIPIPVAALLIGPALTVLGITDARSAFAPYADPMLFLFYGSFFIAAAMQRHGLDRRIASAIVGSRWVGGRAPRARIALMGTGVVLSMWISNTATTAILVPILLGMLSGGPMDALAPEVQQKARVGGLLAISYACSVGGMGTLVGTPPNMIAVRMLKEVGVELTFLQFSMLGLPSAIVLAAIVYGMFAKRYPAPETESDKLIAPRGSLTRGEKVAGLSLGLAIVGFIVPPGLKAAGVLGGAVLAKALPSSAVAMLAAMPLFMLRDERDEATLPWTEARHIDWGLIMLFGGGISLGSQMFKTGLAETLGRGAIALTGVTDLWVLTGLCIAFTIVFTEVCSNTATANMVIPLVLGVTTELHLSPIAPVLGVALAASCAFMMPIATGPNAIVFGSGHVPMPTMVRTGFLLNVLCGVTLFVILRVLCPLYGWQ